MLSCVLSSHRVKVEVDPTFVVDIELPTDEASLSASSGLPRTVEEQVRGSKAAVQVAMAPGTDSR